MVDPLSLAVVSDLPALHGWLGVDLGCCWVFAGIRSRTLEACGWRAGLASAAFFRPVAPDFFFQAVCAAD